MLGLRAQIDQRAWRLVIHPSLDGYLNMAIDELLYEQARRGERPPTLRFYGWEGDWVSFGYFQKLERALNLDVARRLGVRAVRRSTGGKAVVHSEDLTYSVVCGDAPAWGLGFTLKESYRQISRALASGFLRLGLPVDAPAPVKKSAGRGESVFTNGMMPCFAALSDYEIAVGGKKLAGSAQRREGKAFLQHGSIPLTRRNRELAERVLLASQNKGAQRLRSRYATLEEALGEPAEWEKVLRALKGGFEETFGVRLMKEDSAAIMERARPLTKKYADAGWNRRGSAGEPELRPAGK